MTAENEAKSSPLTQKTVYYRPVQKIKDKKTVQVQWNVIALFIWAIYGFKAKP